jgi:hypothetical protein
MNDPNPIPSQGWKPTQSTMGGALFGTAIAQVATAILETFTHNAISAQTGGAITTICIFIVGYLFPDGGRK